MELSKSKFAVLLVAIVTSCAVFADDVGDNGDLTQRQTPYGMEQCTVVDQDGNGLIKPGMADSGDNVENDATAWIYVPYGECAKINRGDFSGVSPAIRNKLQVGDQSDNAQTIE